MSCKVSFIGLGVMGYPMAGYISKAGHNVTVYNRTKSKAEKWIKENKGQLAETPMDAAKDCDFIFTFFSSFGQSFFLGLFNPSIRNDLNISHGQFGSIYALATICSSLTLIWFG